HVEHGEDVADVRGVLEHGPRRRGRTVAHVVAAEGGDVARDRVAHGRADLVGRHLGGHEAALGTGALHDPRPVLGVRGDGRELRVRRGGGHALGRGGRVHGGSVPDGADQAISVLTRPPYDVSMPKIIGGSLHEHRAQTRQKLFAALSTLMTDRGFDAISLADIAAAAGVGRTAVYNHFPDKEALLLGFITHETEQYVGTLERALEDVDDPVEQLRTYIRQQAQLKRVFHLAPGPDLRTVLSRSTRQRLREHAELVEAILRGIVGSGIEAGEFPAQDIDTTVQLVNACLSGRLVPDDPAAREQAIEATEAFVLRAVGADVPSPALSR